MDLLFAILVFALGVGVGANLPDRIHRWIDLKMLKMLGRK